MPIKYSLSARPMNPGDAESSKKVYPMAQYSVLFRQ